MGITTSFPLKKVRLQAILLCLAAATVITSCEDATQDEPPSSLRAIVNGSPTNWKSWTGVVGVIPKFANTQLPLMMCTGTLIQPSVVITAGHCVFNKGSSALESFDVREKPGQVLIKGGANLGMGLGGFVVGKPVDVVTHPSWIGEVEVGSIDLALIKLEKPVKSLPWYCLRRESMVQVGDKGVVAGYGTTSMAAQLSTGVHRSGETTVQSVLDRLIEVGDPSSTCQGDSGGPFFTIEQDQYRLTGVTSFGTKDECSAVDDSWEVNLLTYIDWIDEAVGQLTGDTINRECTAAGPFTDLETDSGFETGAEDDTASAAEDDFDDDVSLEEDALPDQDENNQAGGGCAIAPAAAQMRLPSLLSIVLNALR